MREELIDTVTNLVVDVSKCKPEELDIRLNSTILSPSWKKSVDFFSLDIPTPRKFKEQLNYYGYHYDNYEDQNENAWGLFTATLFHIGAHVKITDYLTYKPWFDKKTASTAWDVIDFIEDIRVDNFLEENYFDEFSNMQKINQSIDRFNEKHIKHSFLNLNTFSKKFFHDYNDLEMSIKHKILDSSSKSELLKIADYIYHNTVFLSNRKYPYKDYHSNNKIRQFTTHPSFNTIGKFNELSTKLGESWLDMLIKNEKMLERYQKLAFDLQFDSVTIGSERYFEYMSLRNDSSLFLKKLRTQVSTISNIIDDPNAEDMGFVEIQKAIQAIASQNTSLQVFEQDTERRVAENWAILLDVSESMKIRFKDIKKFTLCLAETADELNTSGNSWGLFSFNNNFSIIKDNNERYTNHTKARVGGIENKGLSFIADAVILTSRMLATSASEKKFIFIITDASATGYDDADTKFTEAVLTARKSGINVVGIGIPDLKAKCFSASIPYTSLRKTLAKFISSYMEIASSAL